MSDAKDGLSEKFLSEYEISNPANRNIINIAIPAPVKAVG